MCFDVGLLIILRLLLRDRISLHDQIGLLTALGLRLRINFLLVILLVFIVFSFGRLLALIGCSGGLGRGGWRASSFAVLLGSFPQLKERLVDPYRGRDRVSDGNLPFR